MTVFVHSDISALSIGETTVRRDDKKNKKVHTEEGERCWSFEADPEFETQILHTMEFTARSAAAVPLTVQEKVDAEDARARSSVEVGVLAQALSQMANERVAAGLKH